MVTDNRLELNKTRLKDIVSVAKRTMTSLLANIDKDVLAKPDSIEDYKKYNQYINTIITSHFKNKFGLNNQ